MRLVEVARGVRRRGKSGTGGPQSHCASQPHQGGELLGRNSDNPPKTALERTLAQTDIPRQIVDSSGSRSPLKPSHSSGYERIRRGNTNPGEQEILQQLYASFVVLDSDKLFVKPVEFFRATKDASEIGGCPGKLLQRRTQEGGGPHRRKGRQQHRVLIAMFVDAQPFVQAGKGGRRRPPASVDATTSPERKCRDRAGIRQVRIAVKGWKFHHKETLDERPQSWARSLLENFHQAARVRLHAFIRIREGDTRNSQRAFLLHFESRI